MLIYDEFVLCTRMSGIFDCSTMENASLTQFFCVFLGHHKIFWNKIIFLWVPFRSKELNKNYTRYGSSCRKRIGTQNQEKQIWMWSHKMQKLKYLQYFIIFKFARIISSIRVFPKWFHIHKILKWFTGYIFEWECLVYQGPDLWTL